MSNAGRESNTLTTAEAARQLGISKTTLLRWFKEEKIREVARDRRGWRIFTRKDVDIIRKDML
jgi:excisionase family DNA binding protein